jgi:hypothetical protein
MHENYELCIQDPEFLLRTEYFPECPAFTHLQFWFLLHSENISHSYKSNGIIILMMVFVSGMYLTLRRKMTSIFELNCDISQSTFSSNCHHESVMHQEMAVAADR